jgi:lysophospholipase L1-like esterase
MFKSFLVFTYSSIFLAFSIGITACEKQVISNTTDTPVLNSSLKTYLALGDSYTIGQGVQPNERFPYLTALALRTGGINVSEPRYIATTGWTTMNLQDAIIAQNPPSTFDIVTLLIGVNDQYQRRDTAEYRIRFTQLLNKAIMLAANRPNRVFVLSIPDYSATPFVPANDKERVSREITWFNMINKQVTLQNNIAYVDITPLTKDAANDPTLLASDGLHYSAKEHQKWADLLVPLVKKQLQ